MIRHIDPGLLKIYITTAKQIKPSLTDEAREKFSFSVECKCQESLNIWKDFKLTEQNAENENLSPLVAFTKDREQAYVALLLLVFMEILTK